MCNKRTVEILKSIDDNYYFSVIHRASVLKQHLLSLLANRNRFSNSKEIFYVASLLYKLKDKNLTLKFSNLLPSILNTSGEVFPNDVLPFCELIKSRQDHLEIHLESPSFKKNSGLLFFKEMEQVITKSPHIKVNIYIAFIVFLLTHESPSYKTQLDKMTLLNNDYCI